VVVLLGCPDVESTQIFAETVTSGDPSYVGPLAGQALGLPVFHVLEAEIKEMIDSSVYDTEVGVMEDALPVDEISTVVSDIRASGANL
jgi:glycine reductase